VNYLVVHVHVPSRKTIQILIHVEHCVFDTFVFVLFSTNHNTYKKLTLNWVLCLQAFKKLSLY